MGKDLKGEKYLMLPLSNPKFPWQAYVPGLKIIYMLKHWKELSEYEKALNANTRRKNYLGKATNRRICSLYI